MSKTRLPIGQPWHTQTLKKLIPTVTAEGSCVGFSHVAKNAILAKQRKYKNERMESIYFGAQHEGQQITSTDLKEIITTFGLEKFIKLPKENRNHESKSSHKQAEDPINKDFPSLGFALLKELGIEHLIRKSTAAQSFVFSEEGIIEAVPQLPPPIKPETLAQQIKLVREIESAIIAKENESKTEAKFIEEKLRPTDALNTFKQRVLYIKKFSEMLEHFNSCAIYQQSEAWLHKIYQNDDSLDDIGSPVILNDKKHQTSINKLFDITVMYSYKDLVKNLELLEEQVIKLTSRREYTNDLPFVILICSPGYEHQLAIGYSIESSKWIVEDINFQPSYEVENKHLAYHIIRNFILHAYGLHYFSTKNLSFYMGYDDINKSWILYEAKLNKENASQEEIDAYKNIFTFPQIKQITEFNLTIEMFGYTTAAAKPDIEKITHAWLNLPTVIKMNECTPTKLHSPIGTSKISLGEHMQRMAAQRGQLGLVKLLCDLGIHDSLAVLIASQDGHIDIVKELLMASASVESRSPFINQYTPLHSAAHMNRVGVAKLLIEKGGAHLLKKDSNGDGSPLCVAVLFSHIDCIKLFLDYKADCNFTFRSAEHTPFLIAVRNQNLEIVKLLLAKGNVDIDKAEANGWTPLMFAAYNGNLAMLDVLLLAGATVSKLNNDGETALDIARENGHKQVSARLTAYPKISTRFTTAERINFIRQPEPSSMTSNFNNVEPSLLNWLLFSIVLKNEKPLWIFLNIKSFLAPAVFSSKEEKIVLTRFNRFFKTEIQEHADQGKLSPLIRRKSARVKC